MTALNIAVALVVLAALTGAAWTARGLWRALGKDDDRQAAWLLQCVDPPKRETEWGTDSSLLLDCIAIYGDHAGLQRLRDAIDQTRKGDTHG